ncbi:MAG: hypothetical protein HYR74_12630 [Candidatus Eisenbacteria bacterium]|nr:hypothetical protein [Candidatus Eisenbacteria bacterium]
MSMRIASIAAPALALTLLLGAAPALAAGNSRGRPVTPGQSQGKAPLFPVLPDGTPVETSTARAQFTEGTDVAGADTLDWSIDIIGGSMDRFGILRSSSLDVMHGEITRGLGAGFDLSARLETWNRGRVEQGALRQSVEESGYGPTSFTLRERLIHSEDGPSACIGARLELPGAASGPGTHVVQGALFLPVTFSIADDTNLTTMIQGAVVPDVFDTSRDLEGAASLELSHDFAEHVSARCEAVSVWYGEIGRPWLGVVDASVSFDPAAHVGLTLGASGGTSGGARDIGWFGSLNVHP